MVNRGVARKRMLEISGSETCKPKKLKSKAKKITKAIMMAFEK